MRENEIQKSFKRKGFQITEFPIARSPIFTGIRKKAESKKLWVVCDASAKSEIGFSLNDCLEKGQPLQYKLWNVLVRSRFHSVTLCADIEKAFLQIRIRESERDCLRFHWFEVTNNDKIKIYHFARFVFGLTQSF